MGVAMTASLGLEEDILSTAALDGVGVLYLINISMYGFQGNVEGVSSATEKKDFLNNCLQVVWP